MANNITGMNVKLGLDYAEVTKGVKGVKSEISTINSEMRKNMSVFDRAERSTEKYATRLEGLEKKFEAQGRAVDAARDKYDLMVDSYGEGSEEAMKAERALNKQEAAYNNLGRVVDGARQDLIDFNREQKVASSNWTKIGNDLDITGGKIQSLGSGMKNLGSGLTKSITVPVMGAVAAAGTLTAAFGWDRLVGLDSAQAQLKGLGYTTEEIGRVSEQVTNAIDGGMTTMAEGTAVAAGALSAGVEEGAELERYIKLVGDAAVGANRPVSDMAMIFNRVQGQGKLMTENLNMIEEGMPGFSNAMAEHLGVSLEAFKTMVTDGEVTSDQFLDVMENFAGGMADAYAGSWQGMLANTKAYIGQIGEQLLGGVFEQSKESIAEFIEVLKSDAVMDWAAAAGESIGQAFSSIVESIKGAINWFSNLTSGQQKLIGAFALVATAAGPVIGIIGSMAIKFGTLLQILSPVFLKIGEHGLGGALKLLAGRFSFLLGPVGIVIGVITTLATAFITAYTKSETFRNGVNNLVSKVMDGIKWITDFGIAIKNIFTGDWSGGMSILERLGLSDEQIHKIDLFTLKIKRILHDGKQLAQEAFSAIKSFFGDMVQSIKGYWDTYGETIIQAITNAIKLVYHIISSFAPLFLAKIRNAFVTAKEIVSSVWNTITGVISGAVDVIMGVITLFSGLFTLDIQTMWEGVKQIFSGQTKIISSLVSGFVDLVIVIIKALVRGFVGLITGLWQSVDNLFGGMVTAVVNWVTSMFHSVVEWVSNMYQSVKNWFTTLRVTGQAIFAALVRAVILKVTEMVTKVVQFVTNLYNRAKSIFENLRSSLVSIVRAIYTRVTTFFRNIFTKVTNTVRNLKNRVTSIFNTIKNTLIDIVRNIYNRVTQFFSDLFSGVRNTVTDLKNTVTNLFQTARDNVVDAVSNLYDRVSSLFGDVYDKAKETFDNMVDGAKELPGRIGDSIKDGASAAVNGIKSLGNSMADKLSEVVNGVIGGLNDITGAIGIDTNIPTIEIPTFSTGTGAGPLTRGGAIARDTLATVGDRGPGNGAGTRELVQYPNGLTRIYDNDETIFAPKGTRIFSNKATEDILRGGIPRFSRGTGTTDKIEADNKGGLLGTLSDVVSNVWDYITNPKKAFEAVVDAVTPDFGGFSGFASNLVTGTFGYFKDKAFEWVKGIFKDNEGALGSGKYASFMDYPITTPYSPNAPVPGYPTSFNGGKHFGVDYGTPTGTPIHATTNGKVSSFNNLGGGLVAMLKSGKLTQFFMHLSDIVKSGNVKAGDVIARSGNSGKWTTGPHVHWQAQQGSTILNTNTVDPRKVVNGHAKGGLLRKEGLFLGAEGNKEEVVIPLHEPSEAMKLFNYVAQKMAGGSTPTSQLPNYPSPRGNGADLSGIEEKLDKVIELMTMFFEKELTFEMNEREFAKASYQEIDRLIKYKNRRKNRFGGAPT